MPRKKTEELKSIPGERHVSCSQVNTFEDCKRKWTFEKVLGLESPDTPASLLGLETHEQLEHWTNEEKAPLFSHDDQRKAKAAKLATALIPHLPAPRTPGVEAEGFIEIRIQGILFVGYIDIYQKLTNYEHAGVIYPTIHRVYDHKTTSAFKWALGEDELVSDVQGSLYGLVAMERAGVEQSLLQWSYVRTKGAPKTRIVRRLVTLDEIRPRLQKTYETSVQIMELYDKQPDPLSLPPSPLACTKYGGCPFRERCNLTANQAFVSLMGQGFEAEQRARREKEKTDMAEENSFRDRVKANAAKNAGLLKMLGVNADSPPPPIEADTSVEAPKAAPLEDQAAAMRAKVAAQLKLKETEKKAKQKAKAKQKKADKAVAAEKAVAEKPAEPDQDAAKKTNGAKKPPAVSVVSNDILRKHLAAKGKLAAATKPATESAKPATEPAEPATEPAEPATEPATTEPAPTDPAVAAGVPLFVARFEGVIGVQAQDGEGNVRVVPCAQLRSGTDTLNVPLLDPRAAVSLLGLLGKDVWLSVTQKPE